MAVNSNTVSFFNSGSISFRALQTNFGGNSNSVRLSTYLRNTDVENTDPIVPDASENASIPTSASSTIRLSNYRGSIKEYILTQSSSDISLDLDTLGWNSNLERNVIKRLQITGTCTGSDVDGQRRAAKFNATAYNMRFTVSGNIYGYGGAGGSANSGSGSAGGDALFANNTSSRSGESSKISISVTSNGRIWGGGGGGAGGYAGNAGANINCYYNSSNVINVYNGDARNPQRACNRGFCANTSNSGGTPGNLQNSNCFGEGRRRSRCRKRHERGGDCFETYKRNCNYRHTYSLGRGNAGNGGNGGVGQGANNANAGSGNAGNAGNTVNCAISGNSSSGNSGNSGASGGTWGVAGGNTVNASGGAAGRAIFRDNGNTYNVSGATSNNVKGSY